MPDPVAPIPLSYYIKQRQVAWLPYLQRMIEQTWTGAPPVPSAAKWETGLWRPEHMQFSWLTDVHTQGINGWGGPDIVRFVYNGFEPGAVFDYGTSVVKDTGEAQFEGHAWLVDLRESDTPLKLSETETLTVEQDRSVEVTKGLQVDVGVKATQQISGGYAGVSVEASLEESLGISNSTEKKQAQSESQSKTVEKSIEYECEAGKMTYIGFKSESVNSTRPLTIKGAPTWGIELILQQSTDIRASPRGQVSKVLQKVNDYKWVSVPTSDGGHARCVLLSFPTMDQLIQAYEGHNVQFPTFGEIGWKEKADDLAWMYDPANRYIDVDTVETRNYGEEPEIVINDVTNEDFDEVIDRYQIPPDHVRRGA